MEFDISQEIWDLKYRFKTNEGKIIDEKIEDTWRRIANALASAEKEPGRWMDTFYYALKDFKFLPAGRIIAGAGTGRRVTLFNCYVMGTIPDSIEGIYQALKEAALTMQQGGGIGYDFSTIRYDGAPVKQLGSDASGPLSFMDCWDTMCKTIMSAGSRRGAMMGTLRIDHPDILKFIEAKRDSKRLRNFNVSVLVTDDFMKCLNAKEEWSLMWEGRVISTIPAVELWDKIMRATYDCAEPGVIFIDRINKLNNLKYCELISATNPCGEQPLPPYGACLLGSINLVKFVVNAFTNIAQFDFTELAGIVHTAVRMMDNVVDVSNFPLKEQEREAKQKRRIGLGITGLADALAMLKIRYGSQDAVDKTEQIMRTIANHAYAASALLAKEKGTFPQFSQAIFEEGSFINNLDEGTKKLVQNHGLRNALLTSIAPTGTISLYAGNVSSGIEPIFAYGFNRKILQRDGSHKEVMIKDYAVELYDQQVDHQSSSSAVAKATLPGYFRSSVDITVQEHIAMQAIAQKWVDSSISKTINLPEDISFEDFKEVYMLAYNSGCKGCTTYRPNEITGSILSVSKPDEPEITEDKPIEREVPQNDTPLERTEKLEGSTYKLKFGPDEHAMYITINDVIENGKRRPYEIFFNSKNMEHYAWTVALSRMISAVFRRPHNSAFVVEELKAVFDPKGGAFWKGQYVHSFIAAVGSVIEQHMKDIGYIGPSMVNIITKGTISADVITYTGSMCPKCFNHSLRVESGCETCTSCGYSKC